MREGQSELEGAEMAEAAGGEEATELWYQLSAVEDASTFMSRRAEQTDFPSMEEGTMQSEADHGKGIPGRCIQLDFQDSRLSPCLPLLTSSSTPGHQFFDNTLFQQTDGEFAPLRASLDMSELPGLGSKSLQITDAIKLVNKEVNGGGSTEVLIEHKESDCPDGGGDISSFQCLSQHPLSPTHADKVGDSISENVDSGLEALRTTPQPSIEDLMTEDGAFLGSSVPAPVLLKLLEKEVGVSGSSGTTSECSSKTSSPRDIANADIPPSDQFKVTVSDPQNQLQLTTPAEPDILEETFKDSSEIHFEDPEGGEAKLDEPNQSDQSGITVRQSQRLSPQAFKEDLQKQLCAEILQKARKADTPEGRMTHSQNASVSSNAIESFCKRDSINEAQPNNDLTMSSHYSIERAHKETELSQAGNTPIDEASFIGRLAHPISQSTPGTFSMNRKQLAGRIQLIKAKLTGSDMSLNEEQTNSSSSPNVAGNGVPQSVPSSQGYPESSDSQRSLSPQRKRIQSLPSLNYIEKVGAWNTNQSVDALVLRGLKGVSPKKLAYNAVADSLNRMLSRQAGSSSSNRALAAFFKGTSSMTNLNVVDKESSGVSKLTRSQSCNSMVTVEEMIQKKPELAVDPVSEEDKVIKSIVLQTSEDLGVSSLQRQGKADDNIQHHSRISSLAETPAALVPSEVEGPYKSSVEQANKSSQPSGHAETNTITMERFSDVSTDREFSGSSHTSDALQESVTSSSRDELSHQGGDTFIGGWSEKEMEPKTEELNIEERIPTYLRNLGINQSPTTILPPFSNKGPIREPEFSPSELRTIKSSNATPNRSMRLSEGDSLNGANMSQSSFFSSASTTSVSIPIGSEVGPESPLPTELSPSSSKSTDRPISQHDDATRGDGACSEAFSFQMLEKEKSQATPALQETSNVHSASDVPQLLLDVEAEESSVVKQLIEQFESGATDVHQDTRQHNPEQGNLSSSTNSWRKPQNMDSTNDSFVGSKTLKEIRKLLAEADDVILDRTTSNLGPKSPSRDQYSASPVVFQSLHDSLKSAASHSRSASPLDLQLNMSWDTSFTSSVRSNHMMKADSEGDLYWRDQVSGLGQVQDNASLKDVSESELHLPALLGLQKYGRSEPEGSSEATTNRAVPSRVYVQNSLVRSGWERSGQVDRSQQLLSSVTTSLGGLKQALDVTRSGYLRSAGEESDTSSGDSLAARVTSLLKSNIVSHTSQGGPLAEDEDSRGRGSVKLKLAGQSVAADVDLSEEDRRRIEEIKRELMEEAKELDKVKNLCRSSVHSLGVTRDLEDFRLQMTPSPTNQYQASDTPDSLECSETRLAPSKAASDGQLTSMTVGNINVVAKVASCNQPPMISNHQQGPVTDICTPVSERSVHYVEGKNALPIKSVSEAIKPIASITFSSRKRLSPQLTYSNPETAEKLVPDPYNKVKPPINPYYQEKPPTDPYYEDMTPTDLYSKDKLPTDLCYKDNQSADPYCKDNLPTEPYYKKRPPTDPYYREVPPTDSYYRNMPPTELCYREMPHTDPYYREMPPTNSYYREMPPTDPNYKEMPPTYPPADLYHKEQPATDASYKCKLPSSLYDTDMSPTDLYDKDKHPIDRYDKEKPLIHSYDTDKPSTELYGKDKSSTELYGKDNSSNELYGKDKSFNELYDKDKPSTELYDKDKPSTELYDKDKPSTELYDKDKPSTELYDKDKPSTELYDKDKPSTELYDKDKLSTELYDKDKPSTELYDKDKPSTELYDKDKLSTELYDKDKPSTELYDKDKLSTELYDKDKPSTELYDAHKTPTASYDKDKQPTDLTCKEKLSSHPYAEENPPTYKYSNEGSINDQYNHRKSPTDHEEEVLTDQYRNEKLLTEPRYKEKPRIDIYDKAKSLTSDQSSKIQPPFDPYYKDNQPLTISREDAVDHTHCNTSTSDLHNKNGDLSKIKVSVDPNQSEFYRRHQLPNHSLKGERNHPMYKDFVPAVQASSESTGLPKERLSCSHGALKTGSWVTNNLQTAQSNSNVDSWKNFPERMKSENLPRDDTYASSSPELQTRPDVITSPTRKALSCIRVTISPKEDLKILDVSPALVTTDANNGTQTPGSLSVLPTEKLSTSEQVISLLPPASSYFLHSPPSSVNAKTNSKEDVQAKNKENIPDKAATKERKRFPLSDATTQITTESPEKTTFSAEIFIDGSIKEGSNSTMVQTHQTPERLPLSHIPFSSFSRATDQPLLLPYRPPGSPELFYVPYMDGGSRISPVSTVESSHTGSNDAISPKFPADVLGSASEKLLDASIPRHTEGIYSKDYSPKIAWGKRETEQRKVPVTGSCHGDSRASYCILRSRVSHLDRTSEEQEDKPDLEDDEFFQLQAEVDYSHVQQSDPDLPSRYKPQAVISDLTQTKKTDHTEPASKFPDDPKRREMQKREGGVPLNSSVGSRDSRLGVNHKQVRDDDRSFSGDHSINLKKSFQRTDSPLRQSSVSNQSLDELWAKFSERRKSQAQESSSKLEISLVERLERLARLLQNPAPYLLPTQEKKNDDEVSRANKTDCEQREAKKAEKEKWYLRKFGVQVNGTLLQEEIETQDGSVSRLSESAPSEIVPSAWSLCSDSEQKSTATDESAARSEEAARTDSGSTVGTGSTISTIDTLRLINAFGPERVRPSAKLSQLYSTIDLQKKRSETSKKGRRSSSGRGHSAIRGEEYQKAQTINKIRDTDSVSSATNSWEPSPALRSKKGHKVLNKGIQAGDLEIVSSATKRRTRDVGTTFPSPRVETLKTTVEPEASVRGCSNGGGASTRGCSNGGGSHSKPYIAPGMSWFVSAEDLKRDSRKENKLQGPGPAWYEPVTNAKPWREPLRERNQQEPTPRREELLRNSCDPTRQVENKPIRTLVRATLQESLKAHRPDFIFRSGERVKRLQLLAEERKLQSVFQSERDELFNQPARRGASTHRNSYKDSKLSEKTRAIPRREMVQRSKRIYEQLPEVRKRKEEEKRRSEYETYRLKAQLFRKKVTNHILGRKTPWN